MNQSARRQIRELALRMCEGDLDEDSEDRLKRLLNSNPEARDEYLDVVALNWQLESLAGRKDQLSFHQSLSPSSESYSPSAISWLSGNPTDRLNAFQWNG